MDDQSSEKQLKNRIDAVSKLKDFELNNDLRPQNSKIGGYWQYDHKVTSAIGVLIVSMAVITRQSVFSYIYLIGLIKVVKDTVKSGFVSSSFHLKKITVKPFIYYILAASIIYVAAITSNHFIPGIEGGLLHYTGVTK